MLEFIPAFFVGGSLGIIYQTIVEEIKDSTKQQLVLVKKKLESTQKQLDLSKFYTSLLVSFLALPAYKKLWDFCFKNRDKKIKEEFKTRDDKAVSKTAEDFAENNLFASEAEAVEFVKMSFAGKTQQESL